MKRMLGSLDMNITSCLRHYRGPDAEQRHELFISVRARKNPLRLATGLSGLSFDEVVMVLPEGIYSVECLESHFHRSVKRVTTNNIF